MLNMEFWYLMDCLFTLLIDTTLIDGGHSIGILDSQQLIIVQYPHLDHPITVQISR